MADLARRRGQTRTPRLDRLHPRADGAWVRLTTDRDATTLTAFFHYRNQDDRQPPAPASSTAWPGPASQTVNGGLLHARGADFKTLRFLPRDARRRARLLRPRWRLQLRRADDPEGAAWTRQAVAIPRGVLTVDDASVLYIDDDGTR